MPSSPHFPWRHVAGTACPKGFTASPWNGWGGYPVVTSFMVPLDGVDAATRQEWVEFMAEAAYEGATRECVLAWPICTLCPHLTSPATLCALT